MTKTEFDLIRCYDPEIRHRVPPEAAGAYALHRDLDRLELPPDAKPMVFRCRSLTRSQRDVVRTVSNDDARAILAFRFGVLEIRDIPDGGSHRSWSPARVKPSDPLSDDALDALEEKGIGDVDMIEIGSAIEGLSFLAKGVPPACRQPHSSQRAWGAQVASLSHAAPKKDSVTPGGSS